MPASPDFSPVPHRDSPDSRPGGTRQIALVGLNRATAELLPSLLDADGVQVIKVLNPDLEDVARLTTYPHLDVIIDTTRNPSVAARLRKLPLKKVDVISGLGARLLLLSLRERSESPSRALEEIRDAAATSRDRGTLLQAVLNAALKAVHADSGSLMLLDPSRRHLTIEAARGLDESVVVSSIQRVGQGISGYVVRHREPVIVNGAADREAFAAEYQKPEIASSICCPLEAGGEVLGVLNVAIRDAGRRFGREHVESLRELARVAAEAAKGGRESESGPGPGLLNSAREILGMRYRFEERLNLLMMKMANAFGAKTCAFYEFDSQEKRFTAKASSSHGASLLKERPPRLEEGFAQRLLKTVNGFCVNSAGKGPRDKQWHMLQPVRAGAELSGALFLYLQSERNQFREEMQLLKRISDMLAVEIGKHREMESIKVQSLKYSAISQFAADAAKARALPDLAKMILDNLRMVVDSDTSTLRLRSGEGGDLEVAETRTRRDPSLLGDLLEMDGRLGAGTAGAGIAMRIDDLKGSPYAGETPAAETALAAPLMAEGEVFGTLCLYDKRSGDPFAPKRFSEEDQDALIHFAGQAAKALGRFRPFPADVPAANAPAIAGP